MARITKTGIKYVYVCILGRVHGTTASANVSCRVCGLVSLLTPTYIRNNRAQSHAYAHAYEYYLHF